ncbi:MAG TPA: YIP1 family protein [Terriglobales bacterium]|nr:YIP1 family protein [Terriglobales bacterium]
MGTMPTPAPEARATISPVGRLFGVLFSPGKTFEDIVRKPNWVLPSLVLLIFSVIATVCLVQRVDWNDVVRSQIEKSSASSQLTAEQKDQRAAMGAKVAPIIAYVGSVLGPVVLLLLVGLIMWGAYALLGGVNSGFPTAFSITAHSFMPTLVGTPIFLIILFLKPKGTIDIENPMATNLAAFLPGDTAKWLFTLCKSIDIFTIWSLILIAIGFAAVNPKKVKTGKAMGIAFGVWIAYVVVRTGIAWVFS